MVTVGAEDVRVRALTPVESQKRIWNQICNIYIIKKKNPLAVNGNPVLRTHALCGSLKKQETP